MPRHHRQVLAALAAVALAGCSRAPAHYYVLCTAEDPQHWTFVHAEYDKTGDYIMACTYLAPDKVRSYTVRCTDKGCD